MEVDRIRKVAEVIEANPEHFDMRWFLLRHGRYVDGSAAVATNPLLIAKADLAACGTTACIAGWALSLWPAEIESDDDIDAAGMRILGLSGDEARDLFYTAAITLHSADQAAAHLRGMADDYEAASA